MNDKTDTLKRLEEGVAGVFESEQYKRYLSTMARFHNYSAGNTILIMSQMPEATLVAGYKSWQNNFKRQVRKGEKGITILAPCPHRFTSVNEQGDEEERVWMGFRATTVFDISQTDGEPLPEYGCERLNADVDMEDELWNALVQVAEIPVIVADTDSEGCYGYYSHKDNIIVIAPHQSPADRLSVLIHELAHSVLHCDNLQRDSRSSREVQAESVAYVVAEHYGIDTSDCSFAYIAGWSEGKEIKELKSSLELIRDTANAIITETEKALDSTRKVVI